MNRKLIAAAVSAAVIAPVAAQAESSFYASIRNVIDINDTSAAVDAESTTDISKMNSRFGFKGSSDLGNGMTAHGRYEFAVTTDKEEEGVEDTRIATVGLSGGFGRVDVGNQWSSYFNTFGTLVSPTFSLGYYLYSSVGGGAFRASNTIKYSNTFGPLYAELDVRLNGSDEGKDVAENQLRGDGIGLGLTYAVTDNITIAAAFDSEERPDAGTRTVTVTPDTTAGNGLFSVVDLSPVDHSGTQYQDADRIALAVKADFGFVWVSAGWQNLEVNDANVLGTGSSDFNDDGDTTDADEVFTALPGVVYGDDIDSMFFWVGGNIGEKTNWNLGYAVADDGVDRGDAIGEGGGVTVYNLDPDTDDSTQVTWGIYHNMGGGMRLFYEATSIENANADTPLDGDRHLLGMRVDF